MTSVVNTKFAVKPVTAALALAMSAGVALAAPTPNQMPGAGIVVGASLGSGVPVGAKYLNMVSGDNILVDGKVVIRWGKSSDWAPGDETTNPYGFNLGSNALLGFYGTTAGSAVLNIDASGNPSQIFGTLQAHDNGGAGFVPQLFLSNANGIVVGAGGRIVAPAGVGLIGANMDNSVSINDFTANNDVWVNPNPPALGNSYLTFGALPTSGATPGKIEIGGYINGDLVTNDPAKYILVAGNNVNVLNTGNIFGEKVIINAGVIATASTATVNGVTNTTVNRLFNVDTSTEIAFGSVGSAPYELTISGPAGSGNIVNEGSISARGLGINDVISLQGAGNIRSGIDGNNDTLVGLFSDQGVWIDSYSNDSTIQLYNVIAGYTTNKTLPYLEVNFYATNQPGSITAQSFRSDVLVKAITPGIQPSSITTLEDVSIWGGNVTIASTINHTLAADGSPNGDYDLTLDATEALVVSADVGAGANVYLRAGTDMTISGNVISDTDGNGYGGIYGEGGTGLTRVSGDLTVMGYDDIHFDVYNDTEFSGVSTTNSGDFILHNYGQGADNKTTISGDIFSGDGVYITQYLSPLNAPVLISGNIVADGNIEISNLGSSFGNTTTVTGDVTSIFGNVAITNLGLLTGMLETSGVVSASGLVALTSDGDAKIGEVWGSNILTTVGGLNLEVNGPWTAGTSATILSPLALAKFTPDGVVQAPAVTLAGLTYRGVDADGAAYQSSADKPDAQFITNIFTVTVAGNINAPLDSAVNPSNWPLNSMDIAPLVTLAPVLVSVTANGGGFQAVNLHVLGNAIFDTGGTTTPFIGVPLTTGGFPSGGLQGNLGSQLIVQADGSLTIIGTPTGSLTGPATAAQWPGGAAFIAGTTLQLLTPFYNAWTTESPAFGGSFFTAPVISLNSYIATSGTAWANFSTQPVTGNPTVYQIRQLGTNAFGFAATEAFVQNDYMSTVAGGPICFVTGPSTWTACSVAP